MSRYESGHHEPPYRVAVRIAEVLQVPVAYFYCDRDDLADLLSVAGRLDVQKVMKLCVLAEGLAEG
jgi:transcriptional regulator with XRE-family HTH domain